MDLFRTISIINHKNLKYLIIQNLLVSHFSVLYLNSKPSNIYQKIMKIPKKNKNKN